MAGIALSDGTLFAWVDKFDRLAVVQLDDIVVDQARLDPLVAKLDPLVMAHLVAMAAVGS